MSTENNSRVPRLRFPGFTGEWKEQPLANFLFEHKTKSDGKCAVHSVSVSQGVVDQVKYLGRSFAAADTSKYNLAKPGDIIYTKSPTGAFPYGIVKQNKNPYNVIVSPLYAVYTPVTPYLGYILDSYFESPVNTNNYLSSLVQKGAKNTINITNDTFVSKAVCLPTDPAEQKKIAECLAEMDKLIAAQNENVDALKEKKKGLMQQLFPQKGETTPRLRFPGFEGEWIEKRLGDVCSVNRGVRVTRKDLTEDGLYPVFQNTNRPLGFYNLSNVEPNNPFVIIGGSAGLVGFCKTKFWAADDCAYFGDADGLNKYFLYCTLLLHIAEIKDNVRGGNIPRLERASLERIIMHLPSLAEQQKIADCLSTLDDQIAAESAKLEALKDHKKGLMQQLFPQPAK